jgi:hypothetical protein
MVSALQSSARLKKVESRPIILTQNLLEWMGYKGRDIADRQDHFLRFNKLSQKFSSFTK